MISGNGAQHSSNSINRNLHFLNIEKVPSLFRQRADCLKQVWTRKLSASQKVFFSTSEKFFRSLCLRQMQPKELWWLHCCFWGISCKSSSIVLCFYETLFTIDICFYSLYKTHILKTYLCILPKNLKFMALYLDFFLVENTEWLRPVSGQEKANVELRHNT